MDKDFFKKKNFLEIYNIDLDLYSDNQERNLRDMKLKIDMLTQLMDLKLSSRLRQLENTKSKGNQDYKADDTIDFQIDADTSDVETRENGELNLSESFSSNITELNGHCEKDGESQELISIRQKMQTIQQEYSAVVNSKDIYRYIHYYIKYACEENVYGIVQKLKQHDIDDEEATLRIEMYRYVATKLTTPEQVKVYIEEILPLLESMDITKMDLGHFLEGKKNLADCYSYFVTMYDSAKLLMEEQTPTNVVRVYSFGTYQYRETHVEGINPYEILGIVRRNAKGRIESYSGVMSLRKCRELDLNNISLGEETANFSFKLNPKSIPNQGSSIVAKYGLPDIPEDMRVFFANVVCSPLTLKNATARNKGYIGTIKRGNGSKKYGGYELVFDDPEAEEVVESLSVAMSNPGKIKGLDTGIYGDNLTGVLLMAKYAALAAGTRMIFNEKDKEKEENGITQGEE